jgi:ribulose 1,5-bisphosphate synthetase/thiazole synthase
MKPALPRALALVLSSFPAAAAAPPVWIEAESFANHGGWVLDTQFIDIMGSAYLMAHGMGHPVKDATTTVNVPAAGRYRVWVRTKNWVGPWNAPGSPGRFRLVVDGTALEPEFGATGHDWRWEDGGTVPATGTTLELALKDLTGFDGRLDALILSDDPAFRPSDDFKETAQLRRTLRQLPEVAPETVEYDLVVVGGGYAGLGAAISGARQGLKVALLQNRPVLGGNGSSEIQVWAQGGTQRGLFPNLGDIVEEFADRAGNSPAASPEEFNDQLKEKVVRAEPNLTLFLNTHVYRVELAEAARPGYRISLRSVTGLDVKTGKETRFRGKLFSDCTGHATVGALAGASQMMEEKGRMGMSNMWVMKKTAQPRPWPETPWALPLGLEDFPHPKAMVTTGARGKPDWFATGFTPVESKGDFLHGEWFWESGFDQDPINGLERIRDWNFRAVYGAVTTLKRDAADPYAGYDLSWLAFIGGPRESRRLVGDLILTGEEMVKGIVHPDACVPTTWDQDLHYPKEQYAKKFSDNPFISRAEFGKHTDRKNGYPVPYRCLYSKDVDNLFMAGRNISVDRYALGSTRVMKTCGMFGEVVGKAAYLALRHHTTPRGVHDQYLDFLKELMTQPGAARRADFEAPLIAPPEPPAPPEKLDLTTLPGLVLDDAQAVVAGAWESSTNLKPYAGTGYRITNDPQASAVFTFEIKTAGNYEVRAFWQPYENRAKAAPVVVETADGIREMKVDQTLGSRFPDGSHLLGVFEFKPGKPATVTFRATPGPAKIHIDAVQLKPAP